VAVKLGDVDAYVDDMMCGDGDGRLCDAETFGIVGRKFGEVAKESVRFDDGAVANNALKSGEVDPVIVVVASSPPTVGHTASAPSST
jgi:hypothetical protein